MQESHPRTELFHIQLTRAPFRPEIWCAGWKCVASRGGAGRPARAGAGWDPTPESETERGARRRESGESPRETERERVRDRRGPRSESKCGDVRGECRESMQSLSVISLFTLSDCLESGTTHTHFGPIYTCLCLDGAHIYTRATRLTTPQFWSAVATTTEDCTTPSASIDI